MSAQHAPVLERMWGTSCCSARAMGALCDCAARCAECQAEADNWLQHGGNASHRDEFARRVHADKCRAAEAGTGVEHVLTPQPVSYGIVSAESVVVDGVSCVILLDGASLTLIPVGAIIAAHRGADPIVQASLGDEIVLDGHRGRIARVPRPAGRRQDTVLGLTAVR